MLETSNAILVLGMHRTGTSLAMAALGAFGIESGSHLLPPGPDNETGYWEDEAVLNLNERLLAALGKTWASVSPVATADWSRPGVDDLRREAVTLLKQRFSNSRTWGFKDPRSIRLLPFWQEVLGKTDATAQYVICFRNPESVAASLAYRNGFSRAKSYFLWLSHYVPFLDLLLQEKCLFVNYDHFVDNPQNALDRLDRFVDGARQLGQAEVQERVDAFLGTTLRRHLRHARFETADMASSAPHILKEVFSLFDKLAAGENTAGAKRLAVTLQRHYKQYGLLLQELDGCEAEAGRIAKVMSEEEPIRDKIAKMGLYQADIHLKMERFDQQLQNIKARMEGVQETAAAQAGEWRRDTAALTQVLANMDARVEDIQEKVVVQIDELHRIIASKPEFVAMSRDLANAQTHIELIRRSTSWRITRPLRAAKLYTVKMLSIFRR